MRFFKSAFAWLLTGLLTATSLPLAAFAAEASAQKPAYESELYSDATLKGYKQYETMWTDKSYTGAEAKVTVYFDRQNATQMRDVIFYVINWNGERIGTESDVSIVTDYVKAGRAIESGNRATVIVVDFGGNVKMVGGTIEKTLTQLRAELVGSGKLTVWSDPTAATKTETTVGVHSGYVYFLPAGYRVERDILYFESDKHSSLGTLNRVLKAWNEYIADKKKITYAYHTGTAACKCGHAADATCIAGAPQLDQNGNAVPHAEQLAPTVSRVEDCRRPDGSPMSYKNRLDIIYPSGAKIKTPVYSMAATHSPRTNNVGNTESRAHLVGFTFSGYTTAIFDYVYVPMARDDHFKYIAPYGTHSQNAAKSSRAAMRCIRYYAELLGYSSELIGVAGISKGTPAAAVLSTVNNKDVKEQSSFTVTVGGKSVVNDGLYFEGDVIDANGKVLQATVQPYLTYEQGYDGVYKETDREISSEVTVAYCAAGDGINWVYKEANPTLCLGGVRADGSVTTHVPMVLSCGFFDEYKCWDHWASIQARFEQYATNPFLNISMEDQGHTYPFAIDPLRNYDRYEAYRNFFHRYLKPDDYAPATAWIFPVEGEQEVSVNREIEIKFTAAMDMQSVEQFVKIVNVATGADAVGHWTVTDQNTRFIFSHAGLSAGTTYCIKIGTNVKDANGTPMKTPVEKTFETEGSISARPIADTYVSAAEPDRVFGTEQSLAVGGSGDAEKMAFLTFPTEGLFNASEVTLRLMSDKAKKIQVYALDGYRVDPGTLCYSNMPELETQAALIGEYSLKAGENVLRMFELTEAVEHSKVTLVLRGVKGAGNSEMSFASAEDNDAIKPTLVIHAVEAGAPIADTYVSSAQPDTVFGAEEVLKLSAVGGVENIVFASYLQSHINEATAIELALPKEFKNPQSVSVYLLDGYVVDEETLCYSNMPNLAAEGALLGKYTLGLGSKIDVGQLAELVKQSRFTLAFVPEKVEAHSYSLTFDDKTMGDSLPSYNSASSTIPNNDHLYSTDFLFREGGAVPKFKVAADPVDIGNQVASCVSNQTYNRMKFYNTVSNAALTKTDLGRSYRITLWVCAETDAKLSYGMMNASGDYASSFYKAVANPTMELKAGKWEEIVYEITLDETMIEKQVGMFTLQFGTKSVRYYMDDFKVVELDGSGNVIPTPTNEFMSAEAGDGKGICLEAEGVVVKAPIVDPEDPELPEDPKRMPKWLIPTVIGVAAVAAVGVAVAVILGKKKK